MWIRLSYNAAQQSYLVGEALELERACVGVALAKGAAVGVGQDATRRAMAVATLG